VRVQLFGVVGFDAVTFQLRTQLGEVLWFRLSTVQRTFTVETSEVANARSCTTCLMLAPLEAILRGEIGEATGAVADDGGEPAKSSVSNQAAFDDAAEDVWIDVAAAKQKHARFTGEFF
jgi:hypothetical protein